MTSKDALNRIWEVLDERDIFGEYTTMAYGTWNYSHYEPIIWKHMGNTQNDTYFVINWDSNKYKVHNTKSSLEKAIRIVFNATPREFAEMFSECHQY